MCQRGFTLIELLVCLVLISILVTMVTPALQALIDSQRRQNAAQQLSSGVRTARVEAIHRGQKVVIQRQRGDWSNGWRIWVDAEQNGQHAVVAEYAGNNTTRVVGNSRVIDRIVFDPAGRPSGNGTLGICFKDSALSHYQVVIAVTGRVSLRREGFNTEPCA
jgi:type IV fimbrial biogenesis protein FimT